VWIALPQLFLCFAAGYLLRRSDSRLTASVGFICICFACLMVAHGLTPVWGTDQFLPSSLVQAVGQSFALSGIIFFGVLHTRPQDALTLGAAIHVARLMGGEVGQAFIATFIRVVVRLRRIFWACMCRSGTDRCSEAPGLRRGHGARG